MKLKFTKMHGTGNDYVYIDCTNQNTKNLIKNSTKNPSEISKIISQRRFGIGSDGLILICKSKIADFKMVMFNADGSEGKMCGNGIRCVGKYVYDYGLTSSTELKIETKSGIKSIKLSIEDGKVKFVTVDMGFALLKPKEIPVLLDSETDISSIIGYPVDIGGCSYKITGVSMGNPHCIIFCKDTDEIDLDKIGSDFAKSSLFPEGINIEYVAIDNDTNLKMRVFERGSGETLSCGTGACAVVVAAVLNGYCKHGEEITVNLPGGLLYIIYHKNNSVTMKGAATTVFDGIIEI